ncbi:MAG: aspartate 1-decarboxylase [Deltaproteobacteria bacterium]
MNRTMLKSKIHRATVTEANVEYEGSITIDRNLMDAAGIMEYEQVHIFNITTGARFYTYAIEGARGSGVICTNGAAAHLAVRGDIIIIANFASYTESELANFHPNLVYVDGKNSIAETKPEQPPLRIAAES